jgi:electron transfer flavoprotein beta subunit
VAKLAGNGSATGHGGRIVNIVVLTKYVPERTGRPPEIGPDLRLRRETGDGGLDAVDEPGLALARRLAEEQGATVTAVSMGPERATGALQRALATGAHRAVLVSDESLAGADALVTARVLAAALRAEPFDLVIAGVESSDGATGTVPMALAELLGVPCATFARRISVAGDTVAIERQTPAGYDEIECELPALVTVTAAVAEARSPSAKQMIQARRVPIQRLSAADLGLEPESLVATQTVTAIEFAVERQPGELIEDPGEAPGRIVELFRKAQVV